MIKFSVVTKVLVAAVGLMTFGGAAWADQQIKKSEVPRVVLDAVAAKYPDATLKSFERDSEHGVLVYEIELVHQARDIEVVVSPEGVILELEIEVSYRDVPDAVKTALASSRYAKATVLGIEKVVDTANADQAIFEMEVRHAGKKYELAFKQDGELVRAKEQKVTARSGKSSE